MSAPSTGGSGTSRVSIRPAVRVALSLVAILGVLAVLLFAPAGRWDWVEAWAFLVCYGSFLVVYIVRALLKDPGQLHERGRIARNTPLWDRVIMAAYTLFLLMTVVVSGLDAGRFRWSSVPIAAKATAWLGLAIAGSLIFWASATNTYLSRMARIQNDRGHVVISSGPYRYVRHPMYLGIVLLFLCVPVALGSLWALIPGSTIGLLSVIRTSKEDQMLRQELGGYEDYMRRVRFRIMPWVW